MKTINGAILKVEDKTVLAWDAPTQSWVLTDIYTVKDVNKAENADKDLKKRLNLK